MKLLIPTVVSLATAAQGWNLGHAYTPMLLRMSPSSFLLERQRSLAQRMFDQTGFSSPRYELVDDDNKFQLSVDVPGVKQEDIDIELDDGFLIVKGRRVAASESSRFSSSFSQAFSLDRSVDVEQFSAHLSNGVLTITAPKDIKKLEESVRRIPISTGNPSMEAVPPTIGAVSEENVSIKNTEIPVSDAKKEPVMEAGETEEKDVEEIDLDVEK
jgi:HSP20 family molecular chaperone IbpA